MKRFLRLPQVMEATCLSERMVYLLMKEGKFPRPSKIGRTSVWLETEVEVWQDGIIEARDKRLQPA